MNRLLTLALMTLAALPALAQKQDATVIGKWKGESLCTVKPSACHDEVVVYEISAAAGKKDGLVWKADKIVNGEQENMGTLDCSYASDTHSMTCDMPGRGVWAFHVAGDLMTGTLKLADGTLFRKVNVKRTM